MAINPKKAKAKGSAKSAQTKKDIIIGLLSRKSGASLDDLTGATGWLPHSIRGFLSGTIAKKLGLPLTSSQDRNGIRRYTIKR